MKKNNPTSWENSSSWYDKLVGTQGHYYHQQIILPNVLRLLNLSKEDSVVDFACGQGILSQHLPPCKHYLGIDASVSLIQKAKAKQRYPHHQFQVADLSQPLPPPSVPFSHATCILAAQNIASLEGLFGNAAACLKKGGLFICVLNHPCFRIPRQSHWGTDSQKKLQYRRLDTYMSPMEIPIQMHPSQKEASSQTISFHRPLSIYSAALKKQGFLIDHLEEWCSDKVSTGPLASMENRSRKEFPLFLALLCQFSSL